MMKCPSMFRVILFRFTRITLKKIIRYATKATWPVTGSVFQKWGGGGRRGVRLFRGDCRVAHCSCKMCTFVSSAVRSWWMAGVGNHWRHIRWCNSTWSDKPMKSVYIVHICAPAGWILWSFVTSCRCRRGEGSKGEGCPFPPLRNVYPLMVV